MSAPVVYDNIDDANKYVGTLFNGLRFYVHQRVPLRTELINKIKANGGKTVILEKLADMKIGDHVRKDLPCGFHSWKYIEDSIKNGDLCDADDYRIGAEPRPVGSTQPTKGTKNIFTAEEDARLADFMLSRVYIGDDYKGNKLFQDFVAVSGCSRHTWQSYRDNWIKNVRPRLLLEEERKAATGGAAGAAPSTSSTRAPQAARREPVSVVSPVSDRSQSPDPIPRASARGKVPFTPQDDKILRKWVQKRATEGGKISGNVMYKELEEKYPHHTFHSWRDRYLKHVSKTEEAPPETSSRLHQLSPPASRTSRSQTRDQNPEQTAPRGTRVPPSVPVNRETVYRPSPQKLRVTASPQQLQDTAPLRNGAQLPQARPPNSDPSRSPTRTAHSFPSGHTSGATKASEAAARFHELDMRYKRIKARSTNESVVKVKAELEGPWLEITTLAPKSVSAPVQTPKERFHLCYQEYCEVAGIKQVPWVEVGGKALPLWDLWHAATENAQLHEHRDWEEIAEKLGLDWINNRRVSNRLKVAFEKHLGDGFESVMQDFPSEDEGDFDDQDDTDDRGADHGNDDEGGAAAFGAGTGYDSEQFVSSPPIAGQKRRFGESMLSSIPELASLNKRRKYGKDEEIACTPERSRVPKPEEVDSPLQQLPRAPKVALEPETQDFRFIPETQDFKFVDAPEKPWGTPSQRRQHWEGAEIAATRSRSPQVGTIGGPSARPGYSSPPASSSGDELPPIDKIRSRPKKPSPPVNVDSDSDDAFATPVHSVSHGKRPVQSAVRRSLPASWQKATPPAPPAKQLSRPPRTSLSATPRQVARNVRSASSLARERSFAERLEAMGYSSDHIKKAIAATMGDPGLTGHVAQSLHNGQGIPKDEGGVWTEADDNNLRTIGGVDFAAESTATGMQREKIRWAKGALERLEKKHGREACLKRRKFLEVLDQPRMETNKVNLEALAMQDSDSDL